MIGQDETGAPRRTFWPVVGAAFFLSGMLQCIGVRVMNTALPVLSSCSFEACELSMSNPPEHMFGPGEQPVSMVKGGGTHAQSETTPRQHVSGTPL
jgi:hypothetical protein